MGYPVISPVTSDLINDSWTPVGDLVDHAWYRNIRWESGKAHPEAVAILGRIYYMYRPAREEIRDENGLVKEIRFEQKFSSDMWQISRQALADYFGFTTREVDSALGTLKRYDVICTELRTLVVNGTRNSNVLFVGLNVAKLKEISTPITFERNSYYFQTSQVSRQNVTAITSKRKTYTKTYNKTSQKPTTTPEPEAGSSSSSEFHKTVPPPRLFESAWKGQEEWLAGKADQIPAEDVYLLADWIDHQHSLGKVINARSLLMMHLYGDKKLAPYDGYGTNWREHRDEQILRQSQNREKPSTQELQQAEQAILAEKMKAEALSGWRSLLPDKQNAFLTSIHPDSWLFDYRDDEVIIAVDWWRIQLEIAEHLQEAA